MNPGNMTWPAGAVNRTCGGVLVQDVRARANSDNAAAVYGETDVGLVADALAGHGKGMRGRDDQVDRRWHQGTLMMIVVWTCMSAPVSDEWAYTVSCISRLRQGTW